MANIETIQFAPQDPTLKTLAFNIKASVGAKGVNNHKDVILIQALLKYGLEGKREYLREEFPEPCGAFIKSTARLIKKFQRVTNRNSIDKVAIDGRIDPIRDKNAFVHGTKKHWTLYALQLKVMETAVLNGDRNEIDGVCRRWSFLREILNYDGVGTLGLALE